jgi:hypothetical protein
MLESLSLAAGLSWGSGLRLYLTVLLAGVFERLGLIHLPDTLSALSSPWVIGAVGAFVFGIVMMGEALTVARVASAALIVVGLVGLKLSSGH